MPASAKLHKAARMARIAKKPTAERPATPGLSLGAKLLLLELMLRADFEGYGASTTAGLAATVDVEERTIERWLVELTDEGWYHRGGGNDWRLRDPASERLTDRSLAPPERPPNEATHGSLSCTDRPASRSPAIRASRAPADLDLFSSNSSSPIQKEEIQDHNVDLTGRGSGGNQASVIESGKSDFSNRRKQAAHGKKKPEVPKPIDPGWTPPDGMAEELARFYEVPAARIIATVPEFRRYWLDEGARKNSGGWLRAWRNRVASLAKRGDLYAAEARRGVRSTGASMTNLRPGEVEMDDALERAIGGNHV